MGAYHSVLHSAAQAGCPPGAARRLVMAMAPGLPPGGPWGHGLRGLWLTTPTACPLGTPIVKAQGEHVYAVAHAATTTLAAN